LPHEEAACHIIKTEAGSTCRVLFMFLCAEPINLLPETLRHLQPNKRRHYYFIIMPNASGCPTPDLLPPKCTWAGSNYIRWGAILGGGFSNVADDSCDGKFSDARHINKTGCPGSSDIHIHTYVWIVPGSKGPVQRL